VTDEAWARGMADLIVMLPDSSPVDESVRARRSRLYREHLHEFSDEAWFFAVAESIKAEKWFPSVATLRSYAEGFTPEYPMLPPGRGEEEKERDREMARKGLELCAEAFERATGQKAPIVGRSMPHATPEDELDARLEALRRQAQEIQS